VAWWKKDRAIESAVAKSAALDRSQAVIEFDLDGTIVAANENFLSLFGYALPEIIGKHHSLLVDASEQSSESYREFWKKLAGGECVVAESKRLSSQSRMGCPCSLFHSKYSPSVT